MPKTCAEINASLAKAKGVVPCPDCKGKGSTPAGRYEDGGTIYRHCYRCKGIPYTLPDFCGDWKHAGPLFTELVKSKDSITAAKLIRDIIEDLLFEMIEKQEGPPDMDKLIKEAIARAAEAMIEEGEE